jgi:hypothetical protein
MNAVYATLSMFWFVPVLLMLGVLIDRPNR